MVENMDSPTHERDITIFMSNYLDLIYFLEEWGKIKLNASERIKDNNFGFAVTSRRG